MDADWCKQELHNQYECLADFNNWLDGDDEQAEARKSKLNLEQFSTPSKVLFVGDRNAYHSVLTQYRTDFMKSALSHAWLTDTCGDLHWYKKNQSRLMQLLDLIAKSDVVPFVGAGLSVNGGFPTWKAHLKVQGRTAGLDGRAVDELIKDGNYEEVIHQIEQQDYLETFEKELVDSFTHIEQIPESIMLLGSLFKDTLITTNYDRLIEHAYEVEFNCNVEVIDNRNPNKAPDQKKISVIKLHGDIHSPQSCIMGKNQYDSAYGEGDVDLSLPIPKLLEFHFTSNSLLFLGCSLNNDRTVDVFRKIKAQARSEGKTLPFHFSIEQAPEIEADIVKRNSYLLKIGITPIWFQPEQFDTIVDILKYAQHEMNYRNAMTEHG